MRGGRPGSVETEGPHAAERGRLIALRANGKSGPGSLPWGWGGPEAAHSRGGCKKTTALRYPSDEGEGYGNLSASAHMRLPQSDKKTIRSFRARIMLFDGGRSWCRTC